MKNLNFRRAALALALCATAAVGSLVASAPAQAAPHQFVGLWQNLNPATNHVVRIIVSTTPGGLKARTYGKCTPNPCDWGNVGMTTYGKNVSDPDHKDGTAVYNFGFATAAVTYRLVDAQTMVVHTYTQFLDGSGRQNYHTVEKFRKLPIIIDPIPGS